MRVDPNIVYDGFRLVNQGINSSVPAHILESTQYAWAKNITFRDYTPKTRPGWIKRELQFLAADGTTDTSLETNFTDYIFQGATVFEKQNEIVASVGGRLFRPLPVLRLGRRGFVSAILCPQKTYLDMTRDSKSRCCQLVQTSTHPASASLVAESLIPFLKNLLPIRNPSCSPFPVLNALLAQILVNRNSCCTRSFYGCTLPRFNCWQFCPAPRVTHGPHLD